MSEKNSIDNWYQSTEQQTDGVVGSRDVMVEDKDVVPDMSKGRILKNIIVVSLGFLLQFTAFQSLQNLQSSINSIDGLGTTGLSVLYGALVVSCLFLPPLIIHVLGCKWTLPLAMLTYILYMFANLYPQWWTIMPTAVILGLGAAPLWSAKCAYLTETGIWYSRITKETSEAVITRFFGIFFFFFQTSQVWGNLISSLVLKHEDVPQNTTNGSVAGKDFSQCGANFCPWTNTTTTNLRPISDFQRYLLCGIFIGCAFLGMAIVSIFLDKITLERKEANSKGASSALLVRTFRHWRHLSQLLLIPLTMFSGLEQAFIAADFTKSYISCTLGVQWIGYVLICYGVCDAVFSFLTGIIVKHVGRIPVFIVGALAHIGVMVALLLWKPDPDHLWPYFVIAVVWGLCDGTWQTQINALYGCLYSRKQEEAFSNYRLWESLGFIIAYAYSSRLCTFVKLYILIGVLSLGILLYLIVEVRVRIAKKGSADFGGVENRK